MSDAGADLTELQGRLPSGSISRGPERPNGASDQSFLIPPG